MDAVRTVTRRNTESPWTAAILGPRGPVRNRTSMALISLSVMVVFAVVQHVEVMLGLIDLQESNALTVYNLTWATLFVVLLRTQTVLPGVRDPSMTGIQIALALVSVAWSYGITGPARGAVLSIMLIVLLFGMFTLTPHESRRLGWLGFLMLSGVMLYKSRTQPDRYPVDVELIHFCFVAIVATSVSVLSARFGALRSKLLQQRAELTEALERINRLASHDELTGIFNRRALQQRLIAEASRVQRGAEPMCLALIDLDHFKRINDSFGHKAGDLVLQHFAELAVRHVRGGDVVGRWGGEEFLVILPQTPPELALACLERLRQAVRSAPLERVHAELVITFSAGLSICQGVDDIESALERADQAMYRAKTLGRNRTECAESR